MCTTTTESSSSIIGIVVGSVGGGVVLAGATVPAAVCWSGDLLQQEKQGWTYTKQGFSSP